MRVRRYLSTLDPKEGTKDSNMQNPIFCAQQHPVTLLRCIPSVRSEKWPDQLIKSKNVCIPNYFKTSMKLLHM